MKSVEGKVIFITGGASGIGLAMVKELLKNNAKGVALIDLSEETAQKALKEINSSKVIFIKADVACKKDLEEAFEKTVEIYKQLDVVINNAGITGEFEWERMIDVNLIAVIRGSYLAMQKYLPSYKSGDEGVIVNTSSMFGLQTFQMTPVYCASKHGVVSLGEALGGDEFYKKYKVRVLTICPGFVQTPLIEKPREEQAFFPDEIVEEVIKYKGVRQSPEYVAETLIKVIRDGKNGSLWVTENSEPPYEVVKPRREQMRV